MASVNWTRHKQGKHKHRRNESNLTTTNSIYLSQNNQNLKLEGKQLPNRSENVSDLVCVINFVKKWHAAHKHPFSYYKKRKWSEIWSPWRNKNNSQQIQVQQVQSAIALTVLQWESHSLHFNQINDRQSHVSEEKPSSNFGTIPPKGFTTKSLNQETKTITNVILSIVLLDTE